MSNRTDKYCRWVYSDLLRIRRDNALSRAIRSQVMELNDKRHVVPMINWRKFNINDRVIHFKENPRA